MSLLKSLSIYHLIFTWQRNGEEYCLHVDWPDKDLQVKGDSEEGWDVVVPTDTINFDGLDPLYVILVLPKLERWQLTANLKSKTTVSLCPRCIEDKIRCAGSG